MELYIDNRQDKVSIDDNLYSTIEEVIEYVLEYEKIEKPCEISLSIVDNEEIRDLNSRFRSIDKETDVLSFPTDFNFTDLPYIMLGDIIISGEKALSQALEYEHSFEREMVYLCVHSVLHLLGYDHIEEDDRDLMRRKEKEILKKLEIFK